MKAKTIEITVTRYYSVAKTFTVEVVDNDLDKAHEEAIELSNKSAESLDICDLLCDDVKTDE